MFAICASGNSNRTEHGLPFDSPTITLFEVFMERYTRQRSILITGRYGRSFLDPGWETIGNSVAPYLAKSAVSITRAPTLIRLLHHYSGPEVSSNGRITVARNGYTVCPWLRYGGNGLRVLESSSNLIVACTLRNYPNILTLGQPYGPSLHEWGIF